MLHPVEVYLGMAIWANQLKIVQIIRATIGSSDNMMHHKNVYIRVAASLTLRATGIDQTSL
jgi:hypothetical protein